MKGSDLNPEVSYSRSSLGHLPTALHKLLGRKEQTHLDTTATQSDEGKEKTKVVKTLPLCACTVRSLLSGSVNPILKKQRLENELTLGH
jgi:hypothetical protein